MSSGDLDASTPFGCRSHAWRPLPDRRVDTGESDRHGAQHTAGIVDITETGKTMWRPFTASTGEGTGIEAENGHTQSNATDHMQARRNAHVSARLRPSRSEGRPYLPNGAARPARFSFSAPVTRRRFRLA